MEAGWCYDPSSDDDVRDGVTCFYCNISLDGWEPKDDPLAEHQRRSPDCTFFALCEQYKSSRPEKGKRGRASTASRVSRLSIQSVQSVQSTFSEAPSLMSLGDAVNNLDIDASLATAVDTTMTEDTNATKAKKKTTKAKAPAKTKKKAKKEDLQESTLALGPDVEPVVEETPIAVDTEQLEEAPQPEPIPAKPARGRKTKRVDEPQVEDVVPVQLDPPAKPKRTTKAKAKKPETPPKRISQDESQLHSELQDAISFQSALEEPVGPEDIQRGIKRTSDGVEKADETGDDTVQEAEPPVKPKKATRAPKAKKGAKAAKASQDDNEVVMADAAASQQDVKPKRGRKPKKAQQEEPEHHLVAEPEAAAVEEASAPEQQNADHEFTAGHEAQPADSEHLPTPAEEEFEPTPTPQKLRPSTTLLQPPSPVRPTPQTSRKAPLPPLSPGDSAQSSDAENHRPHPSSSSSNHPNPHSTIKKPSTSNNIPSFPASTQRPTAASAAMEPSAWMSPSKTTLIPLAVGTPTTRRSPSRAALGRASPSKSNLLGGNLVSDNPWYPIDLDAVLTEGLATTSPSKEVMAARLADAGGLLSQTEMEMSVEEWVRWRAEEGEKRLREGCERLVGVFEREGGRAMEVLVGIRGA